MNLLVAFVLDAPTAVHVWASVGGFVGGLGLGALLGRVSYEP